MYLEVIETDKQPMSEEWFESNTFLVFDLETTGVDVTTDVPVSYALLAMRGASCIFESYSVVNPRRTIPEEASRIHGISTEKAERFGVDLDAAVQLITEVLLRASREGWYVVGMNVSFDLNIVDARARDSLGVGLRELGFDAAVLDALVLDRHFDPYRAGRRTLDALATTYGVETGKFHDALEDCKITFRVLQALVGKFPEIATIERDAVTATLGDFHQSWMKNYNSWASKNGRPALQYSGWPINGL